MPRSEKLTYETWGCSAPRGIVRSIFKLGVPHHETREPPDRCTSKHTDLKDGELTLGKVGAHDLFPTSRMSCYIPHRSAGVGTGLLCKRVAFCFNSPPNWSQSSMIAMQRSPIATKRGFASVLKVTVNKVPLKLSLHGFRHSAVILQIG